MTFLRRENLIQVVTPAPEEKLSQLTQALGEEFPPAVGVMHLGTPVLLSILKLCRFMARAGGFLTKGLRENGRLVHAS